MSFIEKEEPVKLKNRKSNVGNYPEMRKPNQTAFYSFDEKTCSKLNIKDDVKYFDKIISASRPRE